MKDKFEFLNGYVEMPRGEADLRVGVGAVRVEHISNTPLGVNP